MPVCYFVGIIPRLGKEHRATPVLIRVGRRDNGRITADYHTKALTRISVLIFHEEPDSAVILLVKRIHDALAIFRQRERLLFAEGIRLLPIRQLKLCLPAVFARRHEDFLRPSIHVYPVYHVVSQGETFRCGQMGRKIGAKVIFQFHVPSVQCNALFPDAEDVFYRSLEIQLQIGPGIFLIRQSAHQDVFAVFNFTQRCAIITNVFVISQVTPRLERQDAVVVRFGVLELFGVFQPYLQQGSSRPVHCYRDILG